MIVKVLQILVNWYYATAYPVSQIDPIHRKWMAMRRRYGLQWRERW